MPINIRALQRSSKHIMLLKKKKSIIPVKELLVALLTHLQYVIEFLNLEVRPAVFRKAEK